MRLILACTFLFCVLPNWSNELPPTLELIPGVSSQKNLVKFVSIYTESSNLSTKELPTFANAFQPLNTQGINIGYRQKPVWVKLKVKNIGKKTYKWRFITGMKHGEFFDIYSKNDSEVQHLLNYKNTFPFGDRPIQNRILSIDLTLFPDVETDIYIRIKTIYGMNFTLGFLTLSEFQERESLDSIVYGIIIGVMLLLILSNFFQAYVLKSSLYFYYVAMIFTHMMFFTQQAGYNFQYLWPNMPMLNLKAPGMIFLLCSITWLLFLRQAFEVKQTNKQLDKVFGFILIPYFSCFPILFFDDLQAYSEIFGQVFPFVSFSLISCSAYFAIKNHIHNAYYYAIGTMCSFIGSFMFYLQSSGTAIISLDLDPLIFLSSGLLCEGIIFSAALSQRIRILHSQNQRNKREKILLLEERLDDMETLHMMEKEKREAIDERYQNTMQLASVSHDMRQPLYTIRSTLAYIKDEVDDEDAVEEIDSAIDYAESMLKDTLTKSQAEVSEPKALVSLGHIFNELFKQHFRAAHDKSLILRFKATTLYLSGSNTILLRILGNLVKNAICYTDVGRVVCGIRRRSNGIEIQVIDSGSGIEKSEIENIMSPFERGSHHNGENDGYGLGLNIVKSLCERQGYQFFVRSEPNKGSVFSVLIPV